MEKFWSFMYTSIYSVGAGISTLIPISEVWRLYVKSKEWKSAAYEGKNGWKGVHLPPNSAFFPLELLR